MTTRTALIVAPTVKVPAREDGRNVEIDDPIQAARLYNLEEFLLTQPTPGAWEVTRDPQHRPRHGDHVVVVARAGGAPDLPQPVLEAGTAVTRIDWRDLDAVTSDPSTLVSARVADDGAVVLRDVAGSKPAGATQAPRAPDPEPLHLLPGERGIVQLTFRGGSFLPAALGRAAATGVAPVVLAADGSVAAAWHDGRLSLWRHDRAEQWAAFGQTAGLDFSGEVRVLAVRHVWTTLIEIVVAHRTECISVILDTFGKWYPRRLGDLEDPVSAALVGDSVLVVDRGGRWRWLRGEEELPLSMDIVGVDAVALTAHDVVAVWETASGGTARGAVFVRGLGPGARWRRTDVEGDILRLGLVRPVFDRLRPRAVGPETVTLVTEGANGMTADPVELSLPGVS